MRALLKVQVSKLPLPPAVSGRRCGTPTHLPARHCLGWISGAELAPTDLLLSSGRLSVGRGRALEAGCCRQGRQGAQQVEFGL